jgi:hypothetical protein
VARLIQALGGMKSVLELMGWTAFFGFYGYLAVKLFACLVARRVDWAAHGKPARQFCSTCLLLSCSLAFLPPLALAGRGILLQSQPSSLFFLLFCAAWAIATMPAVVLSRHALRAAGIDPDADAA